MLRFKSSQILLLSLLFTIIIAGGLATYLHTDYVPTLLPDGVNYKAMADAGYNCAGFSGL